MSDLSTLLPTYLPPPCHLPLLSLIETASLTCADLLTLSSPEISRRLSSLRSPAPPLLDIKRFLAGLTAAFAADTLCESAAKLKERETRLTTGDVAIDRMLGGGVRAGGITELVGESGAGKTQFLLTLALTSQLPRSLGGLGRRAVYISTEAPLSTPRLVQLAGALNSRLAPDPPVSTDNVLAITCNDLETQEHILRFQLPVAVARHDVGLVIVDSIAANFRAELDRPAVNKRVKMSSQQQQSGPAQLARRGGELVAVAQGLRELARRHNLVVVVANQVSDRFSRGGDQQDGDGDGDDEDVYSLDFQSRWFTGWNEAVEPQGAKVPALGMVWANRLAARFVLRKADEDRGLRRRIGVVFAGWAKGGEEMEFEIWEGGVRAVKEKEEEEEQEQDAGPSIYG